MGVEAVRVKVIEEPMPFGDVSLAPAGATGRSEAELAQAIADVIDPAPQLGERVPRLTARLRVGALMRRSSEREHKRAA